MRSEFDFIQNIKRKYDLRHVGDDCAVLPKDAETDMVITADMLVEDIDFRLDWTTPEALGHKALAVSLSDVAAMGAEPKWAMLSIGVPEQLWTDKFLDEFFDGWHSLARKNGVELIGGDVSRVPDKLVIDSVVSGEVRKGKAIMRSGAKPGNAIFVSHDLGGAAGGLKLLSQTDRSDPGPSHWQMELIEKQLRPQPRIELASNLQANGTITSMIDLSDGLSSDLRHLCDASGVGARIFADRIPSNPHLPNLFKSASSQQPLREVLDLALHGGEDFELLFTADEKKIEGLDRDIFTVIGDVTANIGVIELIVGQESEILEPKGYRHF